MITKQKSRCYNGKDKMVWMFVRRSYKEVAEKKIIQKW
jgi:hypothetical protein